MMALTAATWNIRDALGDEDRSQAAVGAVLRLNADIVMLGEAYAEAGKDTDTLSVAKEVLQDEGYQVYGGLYRDDDGRRDRHGWLMLGRGSVTATGTVDLKTRKLPSLLYKEDETNEWCEFVGVHLDDRSAETRTAQARQLVYKFGRSSVPTAILGDFNDLHYDLPIARMLRAVRFAGHILPTVEPQTWHDAAGLKKKLLIPRRAGSIISRMSDMATGTGLAELEQAGFRDADREFQPTFPARMPLLQLDRIMVRGFDVAQPGVTVHEASGLSDHRAVSAQLHIAR